MLSGFAMGWRVLGRHLFATIPVFNLVLALGLARLVEAPVGRQGMLRWLAAAACLGALASSALSIRFADQHRKDDYRLAAAIAQDGLSRGLRVWWAADYLGAHYYRLPGTFDYLGELTSVHLPPSCTDLPGVQATSNLSADCLRTLSPPDIVIFSRPETFDQRGDLGRYLQESHYVKTQDMPAIAVWQPLGSEAPGRN